MNILNFLREEVSKNWIDYFVNREHFKNLINSAESDRKRIAQLISEFAEQAQTVEKEIEFSHLRNLDEEGILYLRQKATKLWGHSICCFAALNWDLDLVNKECKCIIVRNVINRLALYCFPERKINGVDDLSNILFDTSVDCSKLNENPEKIFSAWLYARWILKIDIESRFPQYNAKPTVSNPANQYDTVLVAAEQLRNCTAEIRSKVELARSYLTFMLNQSCVNFCILTKEWFLDTFLESPSGIALSVSNSSNSRLRINEASWKLSVYFSMMCSFFATGEIAECKSALNLICNSLMALTSRDTVVVETLLHLNLNVLHGYCMALGLSIPPTLKENFSNSEKLISSGRSSLLLSQDYQSKASNSGLACLEFSPVKVANDFIQDIPTTKSTIKKLIQEKKLSDFLKCLINHLNSSNINTIERSRLKGILFYLSLTIPAVVEELKAIRFTIDELRADYPLIPIQQPSEFPDTNFIEELLKEGSDYWRLLISYDTNELKTIFSRTKFTLPRNFHMSKLIGESISNMNTSSLILDYNCFLLSKLENLAVLGAIQKWNTFCNDCVKELGALGKSADLRFCFAYDAIRVQLDHWHSSFSRVFSSEKFMNSTQELQNTVKGLILACSTIPNNALTSLNKIMSPLVAFFINTAEWEYVVQIIPKLKSPQLDVARLLGAFMTGDIVMGKRVAEGPWWQFMLPTFTDVNNKRKNDGTLIREHQKPLISRVQFVEFLRLIKDCRTLAFLISFLGKLYNSTLEMSRPGDIDTGIFIEHSEFWTSLTIDNPLSSLYISECLETIFKNALIINPINAFWLRSFADFKFVRGQHNDSLILYMETCVACSESFFRPLPENVVDDVMWLKVQRSLHMLGMEVLAVSVCQLMRNPSEHYLNTARDFLDSRGESLDAGTAYFPLLNDLSLIEFLSDVFEKLHLPTKSQLLLKSFSVPEMNSHNSSHAERFRRKERLLQILCSHVFRIHLS